MIYVDNVWGNLNSRNTPKLFQFTQENAHLHCSPSLIINHEAIPSHFQKYPGLDNKEYDNHISSRVLFLIDVSRYYMRNNS